MCRHKPQLFQGRTAGDLYRREGAPHDGCFKFRISDIITPIVNADSAINRHQGLLIRQKRPTYMSKETYFEQTSESAQQRTQHAPIL